MLILASGSPRRRELLAGLGVAFEVIVPEVSELEDPAADPLTLVAYNARLKAGAIANLHPNRPVLGADTTVCVDRTVLNKPANEADARRMLRLLSGRTHQVHTALALKWRSRGVIDCLCVTSEVTFRTLDEAAISDYLSRVHVFDKAGAYALQEEGGRIIAGFSGSRTNVIGLPVEETAALLLKHGIPARMPPHAAA
jgi:septum formation protein